MLKKIFVLLFCFIFSVLSCFATDYKLPPQYKIEVEQTINNEYPATLKKINDIALNANTMYKQVLKDKNLYMDFCAENFDMMIFTPEFYLYSDLIKITQKYTLLKNPPTDDAGTLYDFLLPYFDNNNIDTEKLDKLKSFSALKYKEIDKYYQDLHKFMYPEEH